MVENGQEPLFTEIASRGGPLPGSGPGVINPWRGRPAADPGSVAQIKIPLLRVVNLRSLWKGSSWEGWATPGRRRRHARPGTCLGAPLRIPGL